MIFAESGIQHITTHTSQHLCWTIYLRIILHKMVKLQNSQTQEALSPHEVCASAVILFI